MSGPVCPDCSDLALTYVDASQKAMCCPLCGYVGTDYVSRGYYPQAQAAKWARTQERLRLKKEGKLFFMRITTNATKDQLDILVSALTELFHLDGLGVGRPSIVFPLNSRPSAAIINKIKSISGVKEVRVI